jgi:beta-lactamase class A
MLFSKVPRYYVYISSFVTVVGCVFFYFLFLKNKVASDSPVSTKGQTCDLNVSRISGTKFTKPLLYAEPSAEAEILMPLKAGLQNKISAYKDSGIVASVSVYLRSFKDAQWMSINNDEKYSPGSLMKVPELIAFYKMEEKKPGFLNTSIAYNKKLIPASHRYIHFESKHIELGKTYTVKELLYYMIVHSDNDATMLLNSIVDKDLFSKVFTDVGLPIPDYSARDYPVTAREFSIFMKTLYNSSYLSQAASEACLSLMNQSQFKEGVALGLPKGTNYINKFGESGPTDFPDLGESSIIYLDDHAYLLTIFARGKDIKKLPKVLSMVSSDVYKFMAQ